jgi:peptide deformylase
LDIVEISNKAPHNLKIEPNGEYIIKSNAPAILSLVDYHHPILREVMEPVQFPLSDEDKQLIHDMRYSLHPEQLKTANAPWENAVGMAANQWGIRKRIFLFSPNSRHEVEVIINPTYEPIFDARTGQILQDDDWEGCFSVPNTVGNVKRFSNIRVTYQNEDGETIAKNLSGWPARVWQHENDHLDGMLYDDVRAGKCLEKKTGVKD